MGVILKIFIGILLIVGSIWWVLKGPYIGTVLGKIGIAVTPGTNLGDFVTVVNGIVPPFLTLLGIFIVWLEYDEWKIERELKKEEEKAKRKTGSRRRRKRKR